MTLPENVRIAIEHIESTGHEAYVVGGAVRDYLRGVTPTDWDITTDALPEETKTIFADCRIIETGIRHGTVTVLLGTLPLEITTYRTDGQYLDCRHPQAVSFTRSLEEDLRRRDFTMNAIAYNPRRGFIDPFGGADDLSHGVIRAVGDASLRFSEDALRILRALRFSACLGMKLEDETAAAAHSLRKNLSLIAAERVREELTRLLCGKNVGRILLDFHDVLEIPIPEIAPCVGFLQRNYHHNRDVWGHIAASVANVPDEPVLRWTMLLHDLGKPATFVLDENGVGHFPGHHIKGAEMADVILRRLRFDNAMRERICLFVLHHDLPRIVPQEREVRKLLLQFGEKNLCALLAIHRADNSAKTPEFAAYAKYFDRAEELLTQIMIQKPCLSLKALAINGNDLAAIGFSGREIGDALSRCLEAAALCDVQNTRENLLSYAMRTK